MHVSSLFVMILFFLPFLVKFKAIHTKSIKLIAKLNGLDLI